MWGSPCLKTASKHGARLGARNHHFATGRNPHWTLKLPGERWVTHSLFLRRDKRGFSWQGPPVTTKQPHGIRCRLTGHTRRDPAWLPRSSSRNARPEPHHQAKPDKPKQRDILQNS